MFKKCEIYCYNGLFLDDDEITELNIQKANGIQLFAMLQSCSSVFGLDEGEIVDIDKNMFSHDILRSGEEFFYIVRNNSLILVPIKTYYGIKQHEQLLALYSSKQIRDAKLSLVLQYDVHKITDDMANSVEDIKEFNKQVHLKKTYRTLTFKV